MKGYILLVLVFLTGLVISNASETTIGMPGRIAETVIKGTELEVKPLTDASPVILRIVNLYPHGTDYRYELEYYGLEAGTYDLRDFLQRKDGSAMDDVPALPIQVTPVLDANEFEPAAVEEGLIAQIGGYRVLLIGAGILWVAVLLFALFGFNTPATGTEHHEEQHGETFADRLRPLLNSARSGSLNKDEQAQLERWMISFWRKRLNLEDDTAAEALPKLRKHEEAGVLLRTLEDWLHRPPEKRKDDVDLDQLLKPYQTSDF